MPKPNTASIWEGVHCAACGWPVVFACCNDAMATTAPYAEWDWWVYCANKACGNHAGEGKWQDEPDWVARDG